jgi:hypothetical protein
MDPDPDPAIFVIDLQDASKKLIFNTIHGYGTLLYTYMPYSVDVTLLMLSDVNFLWRFHVPVRYFRETAFSSVNFYVLRTFGISLVGNDIGTTWVAVSKLSRRQSIGCIIMHEVFTVLTS